MRRESRREEGQAEKRARWGEQAIPAAGAAGGRGPAAAQLREAGLDHGFLRGRQGGLLPTLAPCHWVTVTVPSTRSRVPLQRLAVTCVPLERAAPLPSGSFYFRSPRSG